ncbi:MAG: hypothetical protein ABIS07_14985 [Dokdonella sp.]
MNLRLSLLTLALVSGGALAQDTATRTLDQVLTQDEGMSQVSEGLYAQTTGSSESYVAVNAAGQRALLDKLVQLRAKLAAPHVSSGIASREQASLEVVDKSIAELSRPQPKNAVSGDCSGPGGTGSPQLYARALSSGGLSASGYAVLTSDFSPATPTQNHAYASTQNRLGDDTSSQSSTGVGTTAASASASAPNGNSACTASASASVTCPGHTSPSISAFAVSQKVIPNGTCLL